MSIDPIDMVDIVYSKMPHLSIPDLFQIQNESEGNTNETLASIDIDKEKARCCGLFLL